MSDLISRQAVLDILSQKNAAFDAYQNVKSLPSAERPKGKWIKTLGENGVTSAVRCSECGFEDNRYELFNYCPNCGAEMDGGRGDGV